MLRLSKGEPVIASDGRGASTLCVFTGIGNLLEPCAPPTRQLRSSPRITIAFAPVKGDRPEWVVQKLTELGVDTIVPLLSERSVVRWEGARAIRATERLRRIAREAAAQSRRSWLPAVSEPLTLSALVAQSKEDGAVVALTDADGMPPSLKAPVLAVGPEGGWSEAERGLGLPRMRLSDATLRAETAAVVAAAVLAALRSSLLRPASDDQ